MIALRAHSDKRIQSIDSKKLYAYGASKYTTAKIKN